MVTLGLTRRSSLRIEARSSTSSTKTTAAGTSSSSSNVSASSFACRSAPSAPISDGETSKNGQPSREAIPFANVVLPVPGGPKRMIAFGCTTPCRRASSGSASGRITRRSMISLGSSMPRSSSQSPGSIIRPPSFATAPCELAPESARS